MGVPHRCAAATQLLCTYITQEGIDWHCLQYDDRTCYPANPGIESHRAAAAVDAALQVQSSSSITVIWGFDTSV